MAIPDVDLGGVARHPATAGVAGALLLSLRMSPGSTWPERVGTFVSGALVAVYAAPALCEYLRIEGAASARLIGFAAGLFGLSLVYQSLEAIKQAPWADLLVTWLQRRSGAAIPAAGVAQDQSQDGGQ